MSSVLPGCGVLSRESSRGRPLDDTELPRRRSDSELRKSDDAELILECAEMFGVPGGVIAPLSCSIRISCVPMVDERRLVGDAGGVEMVRVADRLGCLPGTARLYPSLNAVSVCTCSSGSGFFSAFVADGVNLGCDVNIDDSSPDSGKVNRGSSAIISFPEAL